MSAVLQLERAAAPYGESRQGSEGKGKSLKGRLFLLVGLAVLVVVLTLVWSIYRERELLVAGKQAELVAATQSAVSIADHYHELQEKGTLTEQAAKEAALAVLQAFHYGGANGKANYVLAIGPDAFILAHSGDPSFVGTSSAKAAGGKRDEATLMRERIADIRAGGGRAFSDIKVNPPGGGAPVPKMNIYMHYEPWGWIISTGVTTSDLQEALLADVVRSAGVAVVAALVLAAIGTLLARGMLRQIGAEPAKLGEVLAAAGRGDLRGRIPGAPAGSLAAGIERTFIEVGKLVEQVRGEAVKIKADAQSIASTAIQVSTAASRQSEATSSMAAGVEELTVSIAHVSNEASQTQREAEGSAQACSQVEGRVKQSAEGMKRISDAIGEAAGKIQGLEERAAQINSIAASIKEIAGQTNLLALNAAIEAARAGEQGRGFSVVADEVRKLAERTASATVEIEDMVGSVQRETAASTATMSRVMPMVAEGVELADQMTGALREISESSASSVKRVKEVASATQEQSSASSAIAQQVESIAQMVEETAAAMSGAARSAEDMRGLSERLDGLVGTFKV